MAKKIKTVIKVNLPAGEATPAPPVGPVLGQHGIPIMDFVRQYNEKTVSLKGSIIPAVITVYEDRTFEFETKLSPVASSIKKKLGIEKGSSTPKRTTAGALTREAVREIAQSKLPDLNTSDINSAIKIVEGTAKSMGIKIENHG